MFKNTSQDVVSFTSTYFKSIVVSDKTVTVCFTFFLNPDFEYFHINARSVLTKLNPFKCNILYTILKINNQTATTSNDFFNIDNMLKIFNFIVKYFLKSVINSVYYIYISNF